jgi:hypothetical protein
VADYVTVPPFTVGQLLGASDMEKIRVDLPLVWDFPAYNLSLTLTATDLLQGAFVVPANAMGSLRHLTLWAEGTVKQSTSGPQAAPAISVLYGSTTLIESQLGSNLAANAGRNGNFQILCRIQMSNSTSAQEITLDALFFDGDDTGDFVTGTGNYQNVAANGVILSGRATGAVNMAASQALQLRARCPVSNNNYVVGLLAAKAWIL